MKAGPQGPVFIYGKNMEEIRKVFYKYVPEARHIFKVNENQVLPGSILFELKDTHGFPLMMSIDLAVKDKLFIEWPSYIQSALSHGHKIDNVCKQIAEAIKDTNYTEYVNENFEIND